MRDRCLTTFQDLKKSKFELAVARERLNGFENGKWDVGQWNKPVRMEIWKIGKIQFENFQFEFEISESLLEDKKLFGSSEKDET